MKLCVNLKMVCILHDGQKSNHEYIFLLVVMAANFEYYINIIHRVMGFAMQIGQHLATCLLKAGMLHRCNNIG